MVTDAERVYLQRCIELAREAMEAGDDPFGSVLVSADGRILAEDRNRTETMNDPTRHPEFELARWAAANLPLHERRSATVYTSGEHCPMCAAAHALVGLGRVVYIASAEQFRNWLDELGIRSARLRLLPIQQIAPGVTVEGPVPDLAEQVRELHRRYYGERRPRD
ncbi:MAG TPA: nucleoside deaminase [Pseudomonadales bacterium]